MQGGPGAELSPPSLAGLEAACFALDVAQAPERGHAFLFRCLNPAMERLSGVCETEARGRALQDVLGGEDAPAMLALCDACVRTRKVQHCTHVVSPPAGRMLWRTALVPLFDSRGMVWSLLGSASLVAPAAPEAELTLHGDILYYNALARMPLTKMLRVVQMRRMDPTPMDPASARLLDVVERLCLAAEEAVEATESAAKAAVHERRQAPVGAEMWDALFESVKAR